MQSNKDTSKKYFIILIVCLVIAATFRWWKPNFSHEEITNRVTWKELSISTDSVTIHSHYVDSMFASPRNTYCYHSNKRSKKFRFGSTAEYRKGFPDLNDIQLNTAKRIGISSCQNRQNAIEKLDSLVYIGENPFYVIDNLSHSIPYLIPRAARLLDEITRSFLDSLAVRNLPPYKLFVTSVLRTSDDIKKLKRVNVNASENSCHQHGTTFDISYNKYFKVTDPNDTTHNKAYPPELKQILAEVIDDLRKRGACFVKYEQKQSCFHITTR